MEQTRFRLHISLGLPFVFSTNKQTKLLQKMFGISHQNTSLSNAYIQQNQYQDINTNIQINFNYEHHGTERNNIFSANPTKLLSLYLVAEALGLIHLRPMSENFLQCDLLNSCIVLRRTIIAWRMSLICQSKPKCERWASQFLPAG